MYFCILHSVERVCKRTPWQEGRLEEFKGLTSEFDRCHGLQQKTFAEISFDSYIFENPLVWNVTRFLFQLVGLLELTTDCLPRIQKSLTDCSGICKELSRYLLPHES